MRSSPDVERGKRMIYKLFSRILEPRKKRHLFLLLPVLLLGSLLETAGIGLLVSVCALLMNGEQFWKHPIVLWIRELLGVASMKDLTIFILLCLVVLYVFKFLYLSLENYTVARFVRVSRSEMAARLFRRIVRAPYTFFVRHGTAEIQTLLGRDMDQFSIGLNALMQVLLESLVALGMGIFLLFVDPVMTSFAVAGIMILLLITQLVLNPILKRASQRQRTANRVRLMWIHQTAAGIKNVRIGRHEDYFSRHFEDANKDFARMDYLKQFLTKLPALCVETILVLSILAYLLFLTFSGAELARYLPGLSALALTAIRLLPSCNRINSSLTQLEYSKTAIESICRALEETEPEPDDCPQQKVDFTKGLSLREVSYTYEGSPKAVLTHVDIDIPAGACVGIVGPSGAGKTTLLDILLGLLTPDEGAVLIDGVPVARYDDRMLGRIAYVPQTTFLLDDTIRNNVAMGVEPERIRDDLVWDALEKAALTDKVWDLPQGLNTQIGERGIRLSGGERQRLGLARAIYQNPALIVFDEATSALDLKTESAVMDSINLLKGQKTLVIVSHRASAIDHCDRVYRVEDGKVVREK